MKRKIISIVLIFMLTLMITVELYKEQAVAVAPAVVLIPAATYAIYATLAATGVIGETQTDSDYLANKYIEKISNYEKNQWNAIAKYGLVAGTMLIDSVMAQSVIDYVTDGFTGGDNVVIEPGTVENIQIGKMYKSIAGYSFEITTQSGYWYCSFTGHPYTGNVFYSQAQAIAALPSMWMTYRINNGYGSLSPYYNGNCGTGISIPLLGAEATAINEGASYNIVGDSNGLGAALAAAGSIAINLPSYESLRKTLDQVEADQALADWLESEMNKVNKTNKPNWGGPGGAAAAIAALAATSYYWLDPVTKNITQTTTQTPPPGEDWIPLPAPGTQTIPLAPSLPDNYPTEDNPEIKTKLSDPIITTIDNGDGTHTETKTQEETKTERYYDPDSQKWIEKTTKTKTTTTTDIDDQTGDRTETGRTTETLPDGNTTESPPSQDATDIDWGPLKQGIGSLKNKFPFCLPWDIYNSFVQFQGLEWSGIIDIDISQVSSKFPVGWDFDIDFSMFDEMRQIVKKIELMLFDLGLILATRKLMGGGV
jgi:hypothetical protein